MKIVNAASGKVGHCIVGPKHFLHIMIRLGEAAICVAREDQRVAKPCVWLFGGIEQLYDYIVLARSKGELCEEDVNTLLKCLDEISDKIPLSPFDRLASALGMETNELKDMMDIAQVQVSAPIDGVKYFSNTKPKWLEKGKKYASIHR